MCASNEGVARLFANSCTGIGVIATFEQHGQLYFGRMLRITRTRAGW